MKKYRKIILLVFVLLIVITSFFLGNNFGKEEVYLDERPKQIKHEKLFIKANKYVNDA